MDFLFLKQVLNYCESRRILYSPVFRAKNYKFESNSQQRCIESYLYIPVFRAKNYKFESNSQPREALPA